MPEYTLITQNGAREERTQVSSEIVSFIPRLHSLIAQNTAAEFSDVEDDVESQTISLPSIVSTEALQFLVQYTQQKQQGNAPVLSWQSCNQSVLKAAHYLQMQPIVMALTTYSYDTKNPMQDFGSFVTLAQNNIDIAFHVQNGKDMVTIDRELTRMYSDGAINMDFGKNFEWLGAIIATVPSLLQIALHLGPRSLEGLVTACQIAKNQNKEALSALRTLSLKGACSYGFFSKELKDIIASIAHPIACTLVDSIESCYLFELDRVNKECRTFLKEARVLYIKDDKQRVKFDQGTRRWFEQDNNPILRDFGTVTHAVNALPHSTKLSGDYSDPDE